MEETPAREPVSRATMRVRETRHLQLEEAGTSSDAHVSNINSFRKFRNSPDLSSLAYINMLEKLAGIPT